MNPQEFAQKIKNKYPQYKDMDDVELSKAIVQKYPQYYGQVKFEPTATATQGVIGETFGDIKETFAGIKKDITARGEKIGQVIEARDRGEQGLLRTLFQTFGQTVGAIPDVIGQTVIGAGKTALPQSAETTIGNLATGTGQAIAGTKPVQSILQKYETLKQTNPKLARDIDSALGIASLGLDVATAGVGGRATNIAAKGVSKGIGALEKTAEVGGRVARRGAFEVQGALTGTSQETLEEAFKAAKLGGKSLDNLTESLRAKVTPEGLVENVRNATNIVQAKKSADFKKYFDPIANNLVNTSQVKNNVLALMDEFGIKEVNGGLDFTASKFRQTPQAQTKLLQMYNEVNNLGAKKTLKEVDTTRQVLKELLLTGDDASARSANALITKAIDSVRESGKQVKGYGEILTKFSEDAEFLSEIQRSLSVGDQATIDTAYRKLATSLKTNNERRMNLLRELDKATGGSIIGSISGQQLSEALPRGLFRQIAAGMAGAGILTGGLTTAVIPALVLASPRVTGEFVRALGIASKKADLIINTVNQARKALEKFSIKVPVASSVVEGFSE